MHPIYSAAALLFGALVFGVFYYTSSRETHRPHSYSEERPRPRPSPDRWDWNSNRNDGVRCGICLDTDEGPTKTLQCKHEFHINCITQWFQVSGYSTCPLCRVR